MRLLWRWHAVRVTGACGATGMSNDDYNFEPRRGLPDNLPAGEKLLWQGSPQARAVASRIFKAEIIAIYFGLMIAWRFGVALNEGRDFLQAAQSGMRMLPLGIAALVIVALFSLGVARTTVYSMTNRRIVMRIGMALPMTINLPLREIGNADLKAEQQWHGRYCPHSGQRHAARICCAVAACPAVLSAQPSANAALPERSNQGCGHFVSCAGRFIGCAAVGSVGNWHRRLASQIGRCGVVQKGDEADADAEHKTTHAAKGVHRRRRCNDRCGSPGGCDR